MGCLPVQRCDKDYAVRLLRAAYEGGIRFFDTANAYTDSEEKIGLALHDVRGDIILSTKTRADTKDGVLRHVENSLRMMKTDYIDLVQIHQAEAVPDADDPDGAYAGLLEAKRRGWIGHIGVTSHRVQVAEACIDSGLFETVQFPFSYISSERDLALAERAEKADVGYLAMKGLAGGLLTNARVCHAFMCSSLGHPDARAAAAVAGRGRGGPGSRRRDGGLHSEGTERALGQLLPQLRLLHALSCGDRDPQLCAHEHAAAPQPLAAVHVGRVVCQDAQDRRLHRLPHLRLPLSVSAGHAEPAEVHAEGL